MCYQWDKSLLGKANNYFTKAKSKEVKGSFFARLQYVLAPPSKLLSHHSATKDAQMYTIFRSKSTFQTLFARMT